MATINKISTFYVFQEYCIETEIYLRALALDWSDSRTFVLDV